MEIYEKQAEADQLMAMARAEKDKRKADSLMNLAEKAQLEADNMQILQEKQDLAYKAELAEQKRVQYTYMGVAGTFLIVLVLVAIGFKQKQKANQLLAFQNEEIRIQQLQIAKGKHRFA